jgi:hypothetical protein
MLSTALIAVVFTAPPAQAAQKPHQQARVDAACNAQGLDRKFVHYVERTPGEKDAPGVRLVADQMKATSFVTDGASRCVTYLTQLDLGR